MPRQSKRSRVKWPDEDHGRLHRIAERRGRPIARVAAARKVLTLVYYGLRDGHIRCLADQPAEAA